MKLDFNKVLDETKNHKTIASLARAFEMNISMFKYNLSKTGKLMLIKKVVKMNRGAK
jgi:hypothetical protein